MKRMLLAIAAGIVASGPAGAAIISGKLTVPPNVASVSASRAVSPSNGTFIKVDPVPFGLAVGWDNFDDPHVRGFDEQHDVVISRRLHLDGGGIIAAGTRVSSHFIVFDAPYPMPSTGSILFSGPVLGLASSRGVLARPDFPGVPGVDYQNPT